jgi:hypothetical protein
VRHHEQQCRERGGRLRSEPAGDQRADDDREQQAVADIAEQPAERRQDQRRA